MFLATYSGGIFRKALKQTLKFNFTKMLECFTELGCKIHEFLLHRLNTAYNNVSILFK